MDLAGKVILVTGAGVRLGAEMARAFAAAGARVAVHYRRSEAEAAAVAEEIGGETFRADLADLSQVEALPGRVAAKMGRVDGLVNSAAVFRPGEFGAVTAEDWDFHITANLRAPFFLSQAFVRALPPDAEGRILNISDARGDVLDPAFAAYSVSKGGLHGMTRGLAVALAPRVRVFGLVLGAMLPVAGGHAADAAALIPGLAPAGTTGAAAAYLFGPGDFATGSLFYLDGGRHLNGGAA